MDLIKSTTPNNTCGQKTATEIFELALNGHPGLPVHCLGCLDVLAKGADAESGCEQPIAQQ